MKISYGLLALSTLIAVAIFVFDILTPKGVAAAVPYVGLILLSRRSKFPPYAFIFAGIATCLTVAGFFLSLDGPARIDLANRGLAIFAIWITASLCYQHIEMVLQLDSTNRKLKKQVVDTVSETVQVVAELQSEREERKQTEEELNEELQDAEERFTAVFNQTFQLIAELNCDGRISGANDTFMMTCGQTRDEILGRPIWELEALSWNDAYQERLKRAVETAAKGDFSRTEVDFTDANGTTLTMDASIKPIRDADSDIYALIFEARDITQHRESQEMLHQAQKTEVIGQLTSGVAHDFNNILAVIGGNLEMSTIHSKPEERRNEHIDRALDAVFRGRELTQQLLAFSRKRRLQRQYVDVVSLIEESVKLVDLAILNDVEIVADMEDGTWSVLSDPSELQTAILNLIVNSKDAMPEGGTITVKTANLTLDRRSPVPGLSLDPGDYVLLSVVDEGTGIPPEILNRVTEPYYTTKSPGSGTGLGLSMVNHFVRETGGAMHIASTVGAGTTATLYLPRSVEAERPDDDVDGASENEYEASDNHILVVEDDAAVRRNVVTMLRDMGYETTEAESGDAAFEMLSNGLECDLVFSDIALPGERSGRDLAREISKFDKGYKVLLTTGVPDHKRDWRLKQSGVPILGKPYRYHELADAIRDVLST